MERLVKVVAIIRVVYIVYLAFEAYNMAKSRRRWWVRPVNLTREDLGFFASCTSQLKDKDEEHFFKATRMSVAKFDFLLSIIQGRLERFSIRKPIQPEVRLTLTLLYLSQGCCPQFLAWSHKIGISTARKIIYETCQALWEELHEVYVAPPSTAEWSEIADTYFLRTGMPHCLGAIDGKLVDIVRPKCSGSLYYTYKKTFSIILLAACDSNYRFTFVDVGALGSQSDGGVFSKSAFGKKILEESLNVPLDQNLPETNIKFPFYFVGDNAFPLRKNLMRPYPGRLLSQDKNAYNKKLSRARVYIENTFGVSDFYKIYANKKIVTYFVAHCG